MDETFEEARKALEREAEAYKECAATDGAIAYTKPRPPKTDVSVARSVVADAEKSNRQSKQEKQPKGNEKNNHQSVKSTSSYAAPSS